MQTFLAIDIPINMQSKLASQLRLIKEDYPQFSWVPKVNFHITVRFFGEVNNVEKLKKKLDLALFDVPAFYLYSQGAGVFIQRRILLHILFQRQKTLEALAEKVDIAAEGVRYSENPPFVPHLTIARYKIPSRQQYLHLKKKLEHLDIDIEFPVDKVVLYQSIFHAQAPEYKQIAEFPLIKD